MLEGIVIVRIPCMIKHMPVRMPWMTWVGAGFTLTGVLTMTTSKSCESQIGVKKSLPLTGCHDHPS